MDQNFNWIFFKLVLFFLLLFNLTIEKSTLSCILLSLLGIKFSHWSHLGTFPRIFSRNVLVRGKPPNFEHGEPSPKHWTRKALAGACYAARHKRLRTDSEACFTCAPLTAHIFRDLNSIFRTVFLTQVSLVSFQLRLKHKVWVVLKITKY